MPDDTKQPTVEEQLKAAQEAQADAEKRAEAAEKKAAKAGTSKASDGEEDRKDAVVLADGIGWRERFDGTAEEQRLSTQHYEVSEHDGEREVSLPEREFDRLEALGAVAGPKSKAAKRALSDDSE